MSRDLQNICSQTKKNTSREREITDQLCCQSMSSLHRYKLPNIADFFFSLGGLIEDLERQLSSASYDRSEFLFWRHDEYKRTLATLSSRYCETYGYLEIGKFTRVYCSDPLDHSDVDAARQCFAVILT